MSSYTGLFFFLCTEITTNHKHIFPLTFVGILYLIHELGGQRADVWIHAWYVNTIKISPKLEINQHIGLLYLD
jgi:hypothetical protein